MIEIKNLTLPSIQQIKTIIYGMRSPLKSWDKSDTIDAVGDNDYALMKKLCKSGTEHRKFMRMINIYMTINAPLYWWKEFDTYKVGTVRNSTSTMHTITKNKFTIDDFSHESFTDDPNSLFFLRQIISYLNNLREIYLNEKDKNIWKKIIELLPSSYMQEATVMINYETLNTIYHQRCNHKLKEWNDFTDFLLTLPLPELIEGSDQNDKNK